MGWGFLTRFYQQLASRCFAGGLVIKTLSPIIRGWCNYYSSGVSSKTFGLLDSIMFRMLWRWAVRKHPNKGRC
ncbi:group II intron maturase-specific domain-containing protein [Wolbachia endosymbiont (group E) of Neria commutata]|uniref:group II intron maturase-specific domain-containing protein n=1 Tax=Wolbachia endosymbiont (group E) of Neria commutata TaxID=3066149 RepID=UPI00397A72CA